MTDDEMGSLLPRHLRPVVRDFLATTGLQIEFRRNADLARPMERVGGDVILVFVEGEYVGGIGDGRDPGGDGPSWPVVLAWAEGFQSMIIEGVMNTWPPCPAHSQHPLWPAAEGDPVVDGAGPRPVVWRCSADRTLQFRVGTLGQLHSK